MTYFAKQVPPEHQESPLMMCDEYPDNIIITGNRHYNSHTTPTFDALDTADETPVTIAAMLTDATGSLHEYAILRGNSQSDWQYAYYPAADYDDAAIRALEVEYFNLGTEWIVHDDSMDGAPAVPASPNEIDGYSIYCYSHDPRAELAEYLGVPVSRVICYAFDGYAQTPKYTALAG